MTIDIETGSPSRTNSGPAEPVRLAVLLTCHNRRDATLRCLTALARDLVDGSKTVAVFLTDDGSTDGTADAVRAAFPWVRIIAGDGDLFWTRGMAAAEDAALATDATHILWLNDDVRPDSGFVDLLLVQSARTPGAVVAGRLLSSCRSRVTYGGLRLWPAVFPWRYKPIHEQPAPRLCDGFSGNLVLIPRAVYLRIGGIDRGFAHAWGDWDFARRARSLGIPIVAAGGVHGVCDDHDGYKVWNRRDPEISLRDRFAVMLSRRSQYPPDVRRYFRKHYPMTWPLQFIWFYAVFGGRALLAHGRSHAPWVTRRHRGARRPRSTPAGPTC